MRNHLKTLALGLALVVLLGEAVMAQVVQFRVPVYLAWGTKRDTIYVGVNSGSTGIQEATYGWDDSESGLFGPLGLYGEAPSPPPDGDGNRVQIIDVNGRTDIGDAGNLFKYDFRPYTSPTQLDSFAVEVAGAVVGASNLTVSWDISTLNTYGTAWALYARDFGTGSATTLLQNMLTGASYTFTADGNPKRFIIVKAGAQAPAAVNFSASPSPVNFGTVNVGAPVSPITLTITNSGTSDPLNISAITLPSAPFSVTGPSAPISLNPGETAQFTVNFNSAVGGVYSSAFSFTHNAAGSPTTVNVEGTAASNANKLYFTSDDVTVLDKTAGYTEELRLNITDSLKAIQFQVESKGLTILRSISKGAGLTSAPFTAASWNFNTQFYRGPANADGSSNDSIIVVIYGNGNTLLPPGDYHLVTFAYDVVNIDEPDTQFTSFELDNLVASNRLGNSLGLTEDAPQNVTVANRATYGDVNDDGYVDILDLLLIVDHILQRSLLTGADFERADVVAPFPTGDGDVNALDLAAVQNMILTGQYPNGVVINKVPVAVAGLGSSDAVNSVKKTDLVDARVTFYINETGVAVRVETERRVKGLQFDLAQIQAVAAGTEVQSIIGEGYYDLNADQRLRVLVYDDQGATMDAGKYIMAHMDFSVTNPTAVKVTDLILADENNEEIENIEVLISREAAPELPVEYSLKQNYPNPFNPTTDIQFSVPEGGNVSISVYNMLGQEVRTLFAGQAERGTKVVRWDGRDNAGVVMPTGTYIYRMTTGSFVDAKKMMLLK